MQNKIKVMLIVFFDICGIVHYEYALERQKSDIKYYQQDLQRFHDAVQCKRPDIWMAKNWQLHHDNAPAHSSHLIQTLSKHGIPVIHQPPYSPHMAPCDFWLFLKLKTTSKGSHFESREDIIQNATAKVITIPKEASQNFLAVEGSMG